MNYSFEDGKVYKETELNSNDLVVEFEKLCQENNDLKNKVSEMKRESGCKSDDSVEELDSFIRQLVISEYIDGKYKIKLEDDGAVAAIKELVNDLIYDIECLEDRK